MHVKRRWIQLALLPMIVAAPGTAWLAGRSDERVADPPRLRLVADLSSKRLRMYEADTLVWQYEISDGTGGYPTPTGNFLIRKMVWNPRWVPPDSEWARKYKPQPPGAPANPMKVVKIFFKEPTYYIHGTSETHRLGQAASHGCIRMDPEHVAEVARYIMEHGGQPRSDNWFMRILRFRSQEKPIYLKNPVPLRIQR